MSDEIFDPEIHAVDKEGNPSLNKDGSFRKKRKDAGAAKLASSAAGASRKAPTDRRGKYHKNVTEVLQIPVTGLSLVDPVYGYAAGVVAPMWADVLADLAMVNPRLAAALEKAGQVGTMGNVVAVGLLTIAQFGVLAGKIPPDMGRMVGAKSREEIEQLLEQRGAQLAKRAAEEAAADAQDAAESAAYWAKVEAEKEAARGGVTHEYANVPV